MAQVENLRPKGWLAQPDPGLTPEGAVELARSLQPKLREQQEMADERGWYSEDVHQTLLQGGLYRLVQPKMFGGYEFDLVTFGRVVMEIARGHPSAGWCYCLGASHTLVVASHWSEQAQREFYGSDGEFRAPFRAPPAGQFTRVEGGYRVTGQWQYSSGSPVSTHFIGGAMIPQADGQPPRTVAFCLPREQYEILDDWGGDRSLGMRASGSNSVKITDQFVPDHHVVDAILLSLPPGWTETPGTRLHGNPMYLGIMGGAYHATFTAILTGTAYAAIDEYEDIMRKKTVMGSKTLKLNDPTSQAAIGEALANAHAAEQLMLACMEMYHEQCDRWARTGQLITPKDTFKIWSIAQRGCWLACDAVDKLFKTASASNIAHGKKMQRYFRDIQMYLVHPSAQPIVQSLYALNYLGLGAGLPGMS
jgi:3-hydroxy-9,10-secoandrosta-1,3,5(10)-triene-9,17-dione monooxygenase